MNFDGIIQFDESGRLYIDHECEMCMKYPLEDLNEPCLACGCSQLSLIQLEKLVNRANKAIDLMGNLVKEDDHDDEIDVREAFLHLNGIQLGGGEPDTMILMDIEQTDEIRKMADLADHMVRVIIYPTNVRNVDMFDIGDDYEGAIE